MHIRCRCCPDSDIQLCTNEVKEMSVNENIFIILVYAGVLAALFASQIDKVAQQSNVIKAILIIVMVLLALFVLLLVIKSFTHII